MQKCGIKYVVCPHFLWGQNFYTCNFYFILLLKNIFSFFFYDYSSAVAANPPPVHCMPVLPLPSCFSRADVALLSAKNKV